MPYKVATGRSLFAQKNYQAKILDMFGSSIVAYWPQNESGGTVSRDIGGRGLNGTYTGVTLRAQGIGDGETAASFDGSTSYNNVYSAGLWAAYNAANSGAEGTLLACARVSGVGVWTDTTAREIARLRPNSTDNMMIIRRTATNNQLEWRYSAGGTAKSISVSALSFTLYGFVAMTWSKAADQVKAYLNGTQVGATQTGLGVWSTTVDTVNQTVIGASSTNPTAVWSGTIGPVLLLNRAATAGEIAAASTL